MSELLDSPIWPLCNKGVLSPFKQGKMCPRKNADGITALLEVDLLTNPHSRQKSYRTLCPSVSQCEEVGFVLINTSVR